MKIDNYQKIFIIVIVYNIYIYIKYYSIRHLLWLYLYIWNNILFLLKEI